MRMFVWRPDGHGPYTFSVLAETQAEAVLAVVSEVQKINDSWLTGGWPDGFTLEMYSPGQVALNDND